jgi:hypothetical protein
MTNDLRPYVGVIWIGEEAGRRFEIFARSLDEAARKLRDEYGEGHVYTLYNEEDAKKPRRT